MAQHTPPLHTFHPLARFASQTALVAYERDARRLTGLIEWTTSSGQDTTVRKVYSDPNLNPPLDLTPPLTAKQCYQELRWGTPAMFYLALSVKQDLPPDTLDILAHFLGLRLSLSLTTFAGYNFEKQQLEIRRIHEGWKEVAKIFSIGATNYVLPHSSDESLPRPEFLNLWIGDSSWRGALSNMEARINGVFAKAQRELLFYIDREWGDRNFNNPWKDAFRQTCLPAEDATQDELRKQPLHHIFVVLWSSGIERKTFFELALQWVELDPQTRHRHISRHLSGTMSAYASDKFRNIWTEGLGWLCFALLIEETARDLSGVSGSGLI